MVMVLRRWRMVAGAVLTLAASPSLAQPKPTTEAGKPTSPQPAQIDRNGVLILVRSTLLALNQANETGNYTVLRDLSAPGFRDPNTAARLGEIFASQRAQKLDLSGVAVIDPQLTLLPQIEPNGLLHMAGFFPSVPSQVNFELLFAPVEGRWRLFGLSVSVGSSTPVAPAPAQVEQPSAASQAKPEAAKPSPKPAAHAAPHRTGPSPGKPAAPADQASPPAGNPN
jgi:hypothetical protein